MITKEAFKRLRGSAPAPDQVLLTLKGDPARMRAVRWRTDVTVTEGFVLLRPAGSAGRERRVEAERAVFVTDMDESAFWFADLTGLEPDTAYEYTVGDVSRRAGPYRFRTERANCERFSFLCLSDFQTGGPEPPADYTGVGEFIRETLRRHPECAFILTAGDNTNCGQTDIQWTGLFEGLRGIVESVPLMLCMGNHDDMGFEDYFTFRGKYYSEHAEYFTHMLRGSYPLNGPPGWETANYFFDYGDARFFVLGTSGYAEMNDWLVSSAARCEKTWKIAVHHFPVCYAGPEIECEDTWPALSAGMDRCDLVFSGHEHSFARSYPRRGDGLYDAPSRGAVHYNLGSGARNPPGTRVVKKLWNAKTYAHEEPLSMYTVATVEGARCTLAAYLEDGRVIDRCVIDRAADRIDPPDPAPMFLRPRLAFKGYDLGVVCAQTPPRRIDGVWYVPAGAPVSFIGGSVVRSPGRIRVEVYGRFAEFAENSDTALTSAGALKMAGPCLRLDCGQLYVPAADLCAPLRMHPLYFERNGFISIESETEQRPVPEQP